LDRHVRGSACRWIISSAKVMRGRLKVGLGVLYTPDYLEPDEMETIKKIAAMDAQTTCPRPTKTD